MHATSLGLAITPAVVSTFFSHYLNRKLLEDKPMSHLSYHQGLALVRAFLDYASHHTVEEVQEFTSPWVPPPPWAKADQVTIPETDLSRAAELLINHLGPDGLRRVGGEKWWQWRKPKSPLKAEWIEMRTDYQARQKNPAAGNRVMLYVHGGAYYFGSVDEHRYQIQRYARKLKARALAPRYRLAPQFPFPCGLQDCLATYLYLISQQPANTVVLAGDSAGGGMVLAMLVVLRDAGMPLPAGAVLVSPWCDLTHSFPSLEGDAPLDFIPPSGFHHKPSMAWPPPNQEEWKELRKAAIGDKGVDEETNEPALEGAGRGPNLNFVIDGKKVEIKEQIQLYTTNDLMTHPLVSPVLQPTLGGLPPLLIMVGGGELLRDEQIYLAHKAANPSAYLPPEQFLDDRARELIKKYKPTDVQLQVWDDMCHVGPTLSFTRPAKFMYRSVAQFAAWALSRAQNTPIDILGDDTSSDNTPEASDVENAPAEPASTSPPTTEPLAVGQAGDPLPPFTNHMLRQRVTAKGHLLPLAPPSELPGCCMPREQVGVVKAGTAKKWLAHRELWDKKFRRVRAKVHAARLKEAAQVWNENNPDGWGFGKGERPPPSALARRRRVLDEDGNEKREKGLGLSIWGRWGSKQDEKVEAKREMAGPEAPAVRERVVMAQGGAVDAPAAGEPVVMAGGGVMEAPREKRWDDDETEKDVERRVEEVRELGLEHAKFLDDYRGMVKEERRLSGNIRTEMMARAGAPQVDGVSGGVAEGPASDQTQHSGGQAASESGQYNQVTDDRAQCIEKPKTEQEGSETAGPGPVESKDATTGAVDKPNPTSVEPSPADQSSRPTQANDDASESDAADMITGVTGRRVMIGGVATPFSLSKDPETASMITLKSGSEDESTEVKGPAETSANANPAGNGLSDGKEKKAQDEAENGEAKKTEH